MSAEIQKVRTAVEKQVKQTDKVIASNDAIAEVISSLDDKLYDIHVFQMLKERSF
jgi:hypothetical protein